MPKNLSPADHLACREAVIAATILARQFSQELFIITGRNSVRYGISDNGQPYSGCRCHYQVTPDGAVVPCDDHPTVDELFKDHHDQKPAR